jgi:hypothetical protein
MKTTINLAFKLMAHRICFNLRIDNRQDQESETIIKTRLLRKKINSETANLAAQQSIENLTNDNPTLAASNHSSGHECVLRSNRTTTK